MNGDYLNNEFIKWYLENYKYIPNNSHLNAHSYPSLEDQDELLKIYYNSDRHLYSDFSTLVKNFIKDLAIPPKKIKAINDENFDIKNIENFLSNIVYEYYDKTEPDKNWLDEQSEYIDNLPPFEKNIIKWYSSSGYKIYNGYIRKTIDMNIIKRELINSYILKSYLDINKDKKIDKNSTAWVNEFMDLIISILDQIILSAPKTKKYFIVYHYSDKYIPSYEVDDNFIDVIDNKEAALLDSKTSFWISNGFYSTSLNYNLYYNFIGVNYFISRIIVPVETACLSVINISENYEEREILFPSRNYFYKIKSFTNLSPTSNKYENILLYIKPEIKQETKYSLDFIFQYSASDLDAFITQFTETVYEELADKRYMTMYYLYKNNLLNKETEDLLVNNSERFKQVLEISNTVEELRNRFSQ